MLNFKCLEATQYIECREAIKYIVNVAKWHSIAMFQMLRSDIGTVNVAKWHEQNKP